MTPEITWTQVGRYTLEGEYRGETWVLRKSHRRTDRGPAGWYLHVTEGGRVLADDGRFTASRIERAECRATDVILGARVRELEETLAATDQLEADTREDVAAALGAIHRYDAAKAAEILADLLGKLGGAPC